MRLRRNIFGNSDVGSLFTNCQGTTCGFTDRGFFKHVGDALGALQEQVAKAAVQRGIVTALIGITFGVAAALASGQFVRGRSSA